ncbi:Protein of unknown function [Streptomyces sp. yr375]|uniref:DUF742 domain-containing protein n=1 Tax=Streptomyces sp. yr375 TaxID=1761906 RepID=UPI0008BEEE5F|nr:DUF742 domain-containing protein [Streptomyces sp. yr375]SES42095.1 Protein of unknown function [Streptomyces sp. yr375]
MSTGEGPSGPRRDQEAKDEQTFADVLNAFSFGNGRRRRKTSGTRGTAQDTAYGESDEASPPPAAERYGPASQVDHQSAVWEPGNVDPAAPASFVRAYVLTGGRTRSHHHFEVETLVTAVDPGGVPGAATQWDRAVLDLCREPRSVAEVAALVAVPLGVAKVLLGDMADRGMVIVHEAATEAGDAPPQALMERVLIGLRQL